MRQRCKDKDNDSQSIFMCKKMSLNWKSSKRRFLGDHFCLVTFSKTNVILYVWYCDYWMASKTNTWKWNLQCASVRKGEMVGNVICAHPRGPLIKSNGKISKNGVKPQSKTAPGNQWVINVQSSQDGNCAWEGKKIRDNEVFSEKSTSSS